MGLFEEYFDLNSANKPYETEESYRHDLYAFLDLSLAYASDFRMQREMMIQKNAEVAEDFHPVIFLKANVTAGLFSSVEESLMTLNNQSLVQIDENECKFVKNTLLMAKSYMMKRMAYTLGKGKEFRIKRIVKEFALTKLEQFLLVLSMAVCQDTKYETLFTYLQGDIVKFPTLRLALALYEMAVDIREEEKANIYSLKGHLFELLVECDNSQYENPAARTFLITKRVYTYLMGQNVPSPELEAIGEFFYCNKKLKPVCIRTQWISQIQCMIKAYANKQTDTCTVLHLYGESGNGRRFSVRHAAKACGMSVLFIEVSHILCLPLQDIQKIFKALELEYRLTGLLLCFIESITDESGRGIEHAMSPPLDYLLSMIAGKISFCIWIAEEKAAYLFRYNLHVSAMESKMLSVKERIILWEQMSGKYSLENDVDLILCANKYILTAKSIEEVLYTSQVCADSESRKAINWSDILAAVKQRSSSQLGNYAHLINSSFTWADLKIGETQKRQMQLICAQLKYRNIVGEEWGFYEKTPYGRATCAMFYGAPGTGKTMAVQVIANELGLDIYRVDVSQMVSKYFGETQKNISVLFQKAKNINALLFFDEADSMFARRSEVKGSNDRSANAETAHLLQKLEEYEGIIILATNYVNNIDNAFRRRIKFMVEFTFPTEDVRANLWKSMLPERVKCEEELDLEFYAKKFELSGSSIKEILSNAAYAAAFEHTGLANRHIVEGIKMNYAKYGKVLDMETFGHLV